MVNVQRDTAHVYVFPSAELTILHGGGYLKSPDFGQIDDLVMKIDVQ